MTEEELKIVDDATDFVMEAAYLEYRIGNAKVEQFQDWWAYQDSYKVYSGLMKILEKYGV